MDQFTCTKTTIKVPNAKERPFTLPPNGDHQTRKPKGLPRIPLPVPTSITKPQGPLLTPSYRGTARAKSRGPETGRTNETSSTRPSSMASFFDIRPRVHSTKTAAIGVKYTPRAIEALLRDKINQRCDAQNHLLRAFKYFDKNRSQKISYREFGDVLKTFNLALPDKELRHFIKMYDSNNDGHIDYYEFVQNICAPDFFPEAQTGIMSILYNRENINMNGSYKDVSLRYGKERFIPDVSVTKRHSREQLDNMIRETMYRKHPNMSLLEVKRTLKTYDQSSDDHNVRVRAITKVVADLLSVDQNEISKYMKRFKKHGQSTMDIDEFIKDVLFVNPLPVRAKDHASNPTPKAPTQTKINAMIEPTGLPRPTTHTMTRHTNIFD